MESMQKGRKLRKRNIVYIVKIRNCVYNIYVNWLRRLFYG